MLNTAIAVQLAAALEKNVTENLGSPTHLAVAANAAVVKNALAHEEFVADRKAAAKQARIARDKAAALAEREAAATEAGRLVSEIRLAEAHASTLLRTEEFASSDACVPAYWARVDFLNHSLPSASTLQQWQEFISLIERIIANPRFIAAAA